PKPDSGPARGTCAAARHQRALGAQPIRGGYVGAQPLTAEHCLQQGGVGGDARFAWPAAHSAAGRLEPIHDARLVRVITSWMVLSWAAVQPAAPRIATPIRASRRKRSQDRANAPQRR